MSRGCEPGGHERDQDGDGPGEDGSGERQEGGEEGDHRHGDGQRTTDDPHREADDDALDDAERGRALQVPAERAPGARRQPAGEGAALLGRERQGPLGEAVAVLEQEERRDEGQHQAGDHLEHHDRAAHDRAALRLERLAHAVARLLPEVGDVLAGHVEGTVVDQPVLEVVDRVLERRPEVGELVDHGGDEQGEDARHEGDEPEEGHGGHEGAGHAGAAQPAGDRVEGPPEQHGDRHGEDEHPQHRQQLQQRPPDDADADQLPGVRPGTRHRGVDEGAVGPHGSSRSVLRHGVPSGCARVLATPGGARRSYPIERRFDPCRRRTTIVGAPLAGRNPARDHVGVPLGAVRGDVEAVVSDQPGLGPGERPPVDEPGVGVAVDGRPGSGR